MGRLFLPTSSSNFNNIFSIEAISPISFYTRRNFGYKRFTSVAPNPLLNSILLYSKYPKFSIHDPDNDNYPMVIEIDDSAIFEKLQCVSESDGIRVYQFQGSVYLDPFSVKVYFASPQNYQTTLVKSEASIETKLANLYKPCFDIENHGLESFIWSEQIISGIKDVDDNVSSKEISLDKKIDCIKGFACSYLIGSNNALPPDLIELKQLSKDIKNDFYSLSNLSGDSYATLSKSKQKKGYTSSKDLNFRYEDLEKKISRFLSLAGLANQEKKSMHDIEMVVLSKYHFNKNDIEKVLLFLKGYKLDKGTLYDYFQSALGNNSSDENSSTVLGSLHRLLSGMALKTDISYSQKLNSVNIDYAIDKIDGIIASFERKYLAQTNKLNFDNVFAIANLNVTSYFDAFVKNKTDFYKTLINKFLEVPIDNVEHFKSVKVDLAVLGGKIFKEFTTEWEGSKEQSYINGLLDHVEQFKPFDIQSHTNITLQSFAAFIIKGDDPEKMMDFMIDNKVRDFRFSLGLWGSVFGFSAIPKTLSSDFFNYGKSYFEKYYISVAKQILSYEIDKLDISPVMSYTPSILSLTHKTKPSVPNPPIESPKLPESFDIPNISAPNLSLTQKTIPSVPNPPIESPKSPASFDIPNISAPNLGSLDTHKPPKCPKCGALMVPRMAKLGQWAGQEFWGCSNFPKTGCDGKIYLDGTIKSSTKEKTSVEYHDPIYTDEPQVYYDQENLESTIENIIIDYMTSRNEFHIKISDVLLYINEKMKKKYIGENVEKLLIEKRFKKLKLLKKGRSAGIILLDRSADNIVSNGLLF